MNIEKIEINGYYVWVDKDAEIKESDWYYWCSTKTIQKAIKDSLDRLPKKEDGSIKIIAASPELKLEGVPSYVEWLAENLIKSHPDFEKEGFSEYQNGRFNGIIDGYQTVEKELFTEEDVRKAIDMARLIKEDGSVEDSFTAEDISGCTEVCTYGWGNRHSKEEIIEQLKQSKL